LSSNVEEYLMLKNATKATPGQSHHAAHELSAARLHLNSLPDLPQSWGRINSHINVYHSDPMGINSIFLIPDITNWWHQQQEKHSKITDLTNVA